MTFLFLVRRAVVRCGVVALVATSGGGFAASRGHASSFAAPASGRISGAARVTDGDTIRIGAARIRMHGIDAPEKAQPCDRDGVAWRCGIESRLALEKLIGSAQVSCVVRDIDRYKRVVGECFASGRNLNRAMVAGGWALAYRAYSMDYVDAEASARAARRGIWASRFEMPWDWRKARRHRRT